MPILYIRDELNETWLPVVSELGAIPDVTFPDGVTNGHALIYHSGSGVWTSGSVGSGTGGVSYLEDLLDVDAESPSNGDILQYNTGTSKWEAVPQSGSSGDMYKSVYDQDNDGIVDDSERLGNQLPSYYATASHSHTGTYAPLSHTHSGSDLSYVNATIIDGRAIDLTDVPTDGQALVWNSSANKWQYTTVASGSGGTNATQLQGRDISDSAPSNLQYLGWNNGTSKWEPKTLPESSGSYAESQKIITFSIPGTLYVNQYSNRFYYPWTSGSFDILGGVFSVVTPSSGWHIESTLKRGTTDVFKNQLDAGTYVAGMGDEYGWGVNQFTVGEYLQVVIWAVGTITPGSNFTLHVVLRGRNIPT